MKLFSGTSNQPLAIQVARLLRRRLGEVEITRFIDNECRVFIKEGVEGEEVFVIQSLSIVADQHLIELCLLGSALKDLKARKVTAVIPWMGYSKQDKAFRTGEAVSAQLVARFIEVAGFDRVITMELHSENLLPYFRIPVTELSTHVVLSHTLMRSLPSDPKDVVVVSPDMGGKSRSERFATEAKLPVVYLDKKRDPSTGSVNITGIHGDVNGKTVIVFDDIINTGATAIKVSEFVKCHGATTVYFLATHAVLAGDAASELEESSIDRCIVTNSIAIPPKKLFNKLSVVSVAPLIADAVGANLR